MARGREINYKRSISNVKQAKAVEPVCRHLVAVGGTASEDAFLAMALQLWCKFIRLWLFLRRFNTFSQTVTVI